MAKGFSMLRKANPNAKANQKSAEASRKFNKKLQEDEKAQVERNLAKSVVYTTPSEKVNYEQPNYQGKSSKKTYKWETENLKNLSVKKYGRSYDEKFKNMTTKKIFYFMNL